MKLNPFTIDLFNPLVEMAMAAQLKKHWLMIVLITALVASVSIAVYRCGHVHGKGTASKPANSAPASPDGGTPTTDTTPSLWTDPTFLSSLVGAFVTVLGIFWQAWEKFREKDYKGAAADATDGVKKLEPIMDAIKHGTPLVPSKDQLAVEIAGCTSEQAAEKLLTKYVITVKP